MQEEPGPTSARAVRHLQALLPPGLPGATTNTHAQEDQEQLLVRDLETRGEGTQGKRYGVRTHED